MPSETEVQAAVRLEYARRGYRLFRNNVGVLLDQTGRPVRYGLANDSPQINNVLKSSDLIGWHPVTITPGHVGLQLAQFVSLECKPSDWGDPIPALLEKYGPYHTALHRKDLPRDDRRTLAQKAWLDLVAGDGGEARFMTGAG